MILSTLQDFNNNFFNLYKFEDFELLKEENFETMDLREDNDVYLKLNGIKYNSYYLFKVTNILGKNCKIYQHKKLMLLFIRNSKYGALICPKF